MKHRILRTVTFTLLLLGVLSVPALARDHHRGDRYRGDRHYYRDHRYYGPRHIPRGPSFSFGFYSNPFYGPYNPYYGPVYTSPTVVYTGQAERTVEAQSLERSVQLALARKGYYGGEIDGTLGPRTRAAIRTYQVDKGLPVTSKVDGALLRSLSLL